jgi:two-component system cell cycle sensor histidine kinase PleC
MPIPGKQPDLNALPPESSPVSRRLATQHVREARDRLTSSGETKPAFKYELLRQYTQNRISGNAAAKRVSKSRQRAFRGTAGTLSL